MIDPIQAFGVAYKEVATRFKLVVKAIDQCLLSVSVEVDHHVAAEDEREGRIHGVKRFCQVDALKVDGRTNFGFYAVETRAVTLPLEEISL